MPDSWIWIDRGRWPASADKSVALVDPDQAKVTQNLQLDIAGVAALDCDRSGSRLVVAEYLPPRLTIINLPSGEVVSSTTPGNESSHQFLKSVSVSPDGNRVIELTRERNFNVYDCDTGTVMLRLGADVLGFLDADWLPDGKTFVTGAGGVESLRKWKARRLDQIVIAASAR